MSPPPLLASFIHFPPIVPESLSWGGGGRGGMGGEGGSFPLFRDHACSLFGKHYQYYTPSFKYAMSPRTVI